MAAPVASGLTYDDVAGMPDDGLRHELIAGELYVTPAPDLGHQHAVAVLTARLLAYVEEHGGAVFPAPTDVFFADDSVVQPDVVVVRGDHVDRLEAGFVRRPDIVAEVSSPATRQLDVGSKRRLYEHHGVPEYWFVDLDDGHIDVHRLEEGRYRTPDRFVVGQRLESHVLAGFELEVTDVLRGPGGKAGPPSR